MQERSEFRLLLVYLKRYFDLFVMFERVDTGDDHRINVDEFVQALPLLKEWGVEVHDPDATFDTIDADGGGEVLFIEFADWSVSECFTLIDSLSVVH